MYSKELAIAVLSICEKRKLSYEAASELCGISPRYFGSIARGQTTISISTLEKISNGFDETPNDLLGISSPDKHRHRFREMQVIHYHRQVFGLGEYTTYPVCPWCYGWIDRAYQAYCSECGQKLGWSLYDNATEFTRK